jgi:hypothetical protein
MQKKTKETEEETMPTAARGLRRIAFVFAVLSS